MAGLMRLRVVPVEGEPYEVPITPKVIVAAEREFGKGLSELFGENARYESLCWAAWKGSQFTQRTTQPFDEWLDGVDAVEAGEEPRVPLETR